jgi:cytidylate kinase
VGYTYIDTGAMYRAVALYCMQEGLMDKQWQIKEDELSKRIDKIAVVFKQIVRVYQKLI